MLNDLRYSVRMLLKSRGFTVVALLTLALGIGGVTAVFSVVYAVLLRPLPFRDPDRLVMVWESHPEIRKLQVTVPDFLDWQRQSQGFEQMAAYSFEAVNKVVLTGRGEPEQLQATMVSENLFALLGVKPAVGRSFLPEECQSGHDRVAMLSHALWQRRFGADPSILGKAIALDLDSFTVVGIVAPDQAFPVWADVFLPLSLMEAEVRTSRVYHPLEVVARLRQESTLRQAQTEMGTIARQLQQAYPATNGTIGASVVPLLKDSVRDVQKPLFLLLGAVVLILLIACANVANLLLSRATLRKKEVAIRTALGAGRGRLIRQFLTESMALALPGAGLGLLLAYWSVPLLRAMAAGRLPRAGQIDLSWGALCFAFGATVFTGVLLGLVPAFRASSACDLSRSLKEGKGRASVASESGRGLNMVTAAEVTLATVVLVGTGLLVRSFQQLLKVDPGFRTKSILTMQISLPSTKYGWEQAERFFQQRLFPRVRVLPGVEGVSVINSHPMSLELSERLRFASRFWIEGKPTPDPGRFPVAQIRWASSDYFRVMGIALRQGRLLDEADGGKPHYLINETLAQRFFRDQDPVGRRLLLDVMAREPKAIHIVGVVADIKELGLDKEVEPTLYQMDVSPRMTLLVRTRGDPLSLGSAVRHEVLAVDPEQPVHEIRSIDQVLSSSLAPRRLSMSLMSVFAALALLLAMVGIYGVVTYAVTQRTQEIGIRVTLGAQYIDVLGLVVGQGMTSVLVGVLTGSVGALVLARLMSSLLFGVGAYDLVTFTVAPLILVLIGLLACYFPARRAMKVDPVVALRYE